MTTNGQSSSILLVDDEPMVRDVYQQLLNDDYEVRTAENGDKALERIDETIDIVLLDRRMPGMSGREVLAAIRDHGYRCMVVMFTAVEPNTDVIEMGFDEYLVKPVPSDELKATIDSLLARATYQEEIRRFLSLTAKQAMIESRHDPEVLANDQEYQTLLDEIERTHEQANEQFDEIPASDTELLFRKLDRAQPV